MPYVEYGMLLHISMLKIFRLARQGSVVNISYFKCGTLCAGSSSWPDFMEPHVRDWWASKFALSEYPGSALNLYTWNDMNEPSVFNGPEITFSRDQKHLAGWENREVHNVYGMHVVRRRRSTVLYIYMCVCVICDKTGRLDNTISGLKIFYFLLFSCYCFQNLYLLIIFVLCSL